MLKKSRDVIIVLTHVQIARSCKAHTAVMSELEQRVEHVVNSCSEAIMMRFHPAACLSVVSVAAVHLLTYILPCGCDPPFDTALPNTWERWISSPCGRWRLRHHQQVRSSGLQVQVTKFFRKASSLGGEERPSGARKNAAMFRRLL